MPRSKTLFADLRRRWARMPQSNRMWLSCLMALTLAIAACMISVRQKPSSELLLAGRTFTARELIALEGAFSKSGLGNYEVVGSTVRIPREHRSDYVAALVDAGIVPSTAGAPKLSKTMGFGESTGHRMARERAVLEQELSNYVRRFHDIEDASVRFDEAVTGQGFQRTNRVTSMVVVQPTNGRLSSERVRSICRLVASAKVELLENDVTVTDLSTGRCYGGASLANVNYQQTDDFVLRKQEAEQQWTAKIADALPFIPGAKVATNVDLRTRDADVTGSGAPGLFAQSVAVSVSVPESYYQAVWARHRDLASQQLGAKPEETTLAAIEHKTRERINQTLMPLLPKTPATDGQVGSHVSVVSFSDGLNVAGNNAPLVVGGMADWFRSHIFWSMIALLGATVLGFYALRGVGSDLQRMWLDRHEETSSSLRVVRDESHSRYQPPHKPGDSRPLAGGVVSSNDETGYEIQHVEIEDSATQSIAEEDRSLIEMSTQSTDDVFADGPSAVNDELTQIVRENPDAAAEMLKQWIDKAG